MSTITIRPDTSFPTWSQVTLTGGSDPSAVTRDNSDSTYATFGYPSASQPSLVRMRLTDPVIPAGETIARVRVRVRFLTLSGSVQWAWTLQDSSGQSAAADSMIIDQPAVATTSGGWKTTAPDGGAWTPEKVNDLRVQLQYFKIGVGFPRVHEVYVDVETTTPPTAAVSAPTGTVSGTSQPYVVSAYADTEGDLQDAYEIKVYSAAQYGAGGFSADTSEPTWTSGVVVTADPVNHKITPSLTNAVYRAFVRYRNQAVVGGQWGAWSYSQFTVNVTPANAPTLVATADSPAARVSLALAGTGPALPSGHRYFEVERTTDAGATWERLERALPTDLDAYTYTSPTQALTVYDYEAPRGVAVQYRARVVSVLASGDVTISTWTTSGAVTLTTSGWHLKSLTDASLNTRLYVMAGSVTESKPQDVAVLDPIDEDGTIVVWGRKRGQRLKFTLRFPTVASWLAFNALRDQQETLLLQTNDGRQWFLALLGDRDTSETPMGSAWVERRLPLQAVEVAP